MNKELIFDVMKPTASIDSELLCRSMGVKLKQVSCAMHMQSIEDFMCERSHFVFGV